MNRTRSTTAGPFLASVFGLFLAVCLLKIGNPVILDHLIELPTNLDGWRAFSWPVRVGYLGLGLIVLIAVPVFRLRPAPPAYTLGFLALWLGWQFATGFGSTEPAATRAVIPHFIACAVCFLLGSFALSRVPQTRVFWLCLAGGVVGVVALGWEQHFGGLEATRRYVFEHTDWQQMPPEYRLRLESNRVFSTLVYPNALAGAILLLLPPSTVVAWQGGARIGRWGPVTLAGLMLAGGLGCLAWSGSKAGWLLAMGLLIVVVLHTRLGLRWKALVAVGVVIAGLAGFAIKYAERLRRGPTSVAARLDYWTAAWRGFLSRPLVGYGPGAFKTLYARTKPAGAEMAQLAHNDYLQQACDSGIAGVVGYTAFVWGTLGGLYRRRDGATPLERAIWLGLLGWFAQGWVEFGLYVPATAWCAFSLIGWLSVVGQAAVSEGHHTHGKWRNNTRGSR